MKLTSDCSIAAELQINGVVVSAVDVVTMMGLETAASCLGSPFNFTKAWMPYIALGQGEASPSTEDKFLETEKYRQEGDVSNSGIKYVVHTIFSGFTTAWIMREVGMLDKLVGGRLGVRWQLAVDYAIAVGDLVDVTCTIYIV